jgi:membrane dipeptidase
MAKMSANMLEKARNFLERVPLIDGHNDLPYVIRHSASKGDLADYDLTREHQETDTDIPRLKRGKLAAQFWAAYCPTDAKDPTRYTLELIALIRAMNERHSDVFMPAFRASDVRKAKCLGKIASFIAVENGAGIGDRLEMLDIFHALGARYMTLCHNDTLAWVDSATDEARHNGLTSFGKNVIQHMNKIGLLIDLSHTSEKSMHDALDVSSVPIAITHSNARSLCEHPRNTTDAVMDRLKTNGGIIMATFVPNFISQDVWNHNRPFFARMRLPGDQLRSGPAPRATLDEFCTHLEYMTQRVGINHIGIGSDFYGGPVPVGLEDVSKFPDLIAALMQRGWSEKNLEKLASRNFLRVLRAVEKAATLVKA